MTTDFRDIRSTVDSGRLDGDQRVVQQRIGRPRQTLLDDDGDAPPEPPFVLPSVRAETGALLERQLLISGGLEERRLPPVLGDRGSRRIALIFGLLALAGGTAGFALHVHYQNMRDELRAELSERNEQIAAVQSDNERLRREQRDAELRFEKTTGELAREVTEKQRIRLEAEQKESELKRAREELLSLRGAIDGLKERYRRLEAGRLSELGAILQESLLAPLELFRSISRPAGAAAAAGPVPRESTTDGVAREEAQDSARRQPMTNAEVPNDE